MATGRLDRAAAHGPLTKAELRPTQPRSPSRHAAAASLRSHPQPFHTTLSFSPSRSAVLLLVLLLIPLALSCIARDAAALPPVQHHVYYSGSHVTSIALQTDAGDLFATDVVHGRVIHYNASGRVAAVWTVTNPSLFSPTSIAYASIDVDYSTPQMFVTDSTTGAVVKVNPDTGEQEPNAVLSIPAEIWECGLLLAQYDGDDLALFVIDRHRAITASFDDVATGRPPTRVTVSTPAPAPPGSNLTAAYIAAAAAVGSSYTDVLYLVDGTGDRILRMTVGDLNYTEPLLFELPADVRGIQAVSFTWCTRFDPNEFGCLWVLYQPDRSTMQQTVIAVSVLNGSVVNSFTIGTEAEERVAAAWGSRNEHLSTQATIGALLPSPALHVTGSGVTDDSFRVYIAEADLDGPGHVVTARSENGSLLQRYDSIPAQYDTTGHLMHAFSAVQTDSEYCTLWLTDVDNGGMLVRAAADGTILQHFATPALFSSVVLDVSSGADSSSLVLLFSNATDWQLWRFYPAIGVFTQLDTTSVRQRYNSTDSGGTAGLADEASVAVGGLSIDGTGRLLLSLPYAKTVVRLGTNGEWDPTFNTSDGLSRPSVVVWANMHGVDVVDQSGLHGDWYIRVCDKVDGAVVGSFPVVSPMSQPLALMYDAQFTWLWISDVNGLIFRLYPYSLSVATGGIYQPMPAAFNMRSMSIDQYGTLYGAEATTRRLVMLFVFADARFKPQSQPCKVYPVPVISSSSSSSSSSSTGAVQPARPPSEGLLDDIDPLVAGGVCAAVLVVLIGAVSRHHWLRRRRSSEGGGRGVESDEAESEEEEEEEEAAYQQCEDGPYVVTVSSERVTGEMAVQGGGDSDASTDSQSPADEERASPAGDRPLMYVVEAPARRYDAYVRLYEALSDADRHAKWYGNLSYGGRKDGSGSYPHGTPSTSIEPLSPSASPSPLPSPSSHSSRERFYQSSNDSGSSGSSAGSSRSRTGRGEPRVADSAVLAPSTIARLVSNCVPRFIDEVTDLRILGEGQSGVVYCGYYGSMAVVVKLPKVRSMSAAQWREWQAHLRLPSHPSLVSFVGSLVMYDTNYLVLKWVEQGSLASLLNSPTASRTARWYSRPYGVMRAAADVAQALHHVHRHHLTHRDVSCRNVLVTADGTFVLADLGLAQEPDDTSTSTNTSSVTPLTPLAVPLRWSSPDYLSSHRFTGKSDVWALGVTLWEMASGGRRPYEHISDNRQLQQHIEQGTVGLTVDREWMEQYEQTDEGGLVHTVKQTIDTCMSRDVARRPDAEQLAERVQREMAKWEAEAGEAAERVKAQWAADHAKLAAEVAAVQEAHRAAAANTEAAAHTPAHTPAQPRLVPVPLPSLPALHSAALLGSVSASAVDDDEDE